VAKLNLRKSTLALFLVMLTAGIGTTIVQKAIAPERASTMLADAGGSDPAPPDPGPNSAAFAALHLT
jgi:hypothetical protein